MVLVRNLLAFLCCACGLLLALHLIGNKVDVAGAASAEGYGVQIHAEKQAELQRSNLISFSGQDTWPRTVSDSDTSATVPDINDDSAGIPPGMIINIGDNLNADEPYLSRSSSPAKTNLGIRVEAYPPAEHDELGAPQNLGEPIDVDCLDCVTTDGPVENRNIGAEMSMEEYYQVDGPAGNESRNIGPDMEIEPYLAGQ